MKASKIEELASHPFLSPGEPSDDLTALPAVYKVWEKNCLILISETQTRTNDRICLTVGFLWLLVEK
jgi:hypothetical protein